MYGLNDDSVYMQTIYFNGIKKRGKVSFLSLLVRRVMTAQFGENIDNNIEIPIDEKTAEHIQRYLQKLVPPQPKLVERGNDEEPLE